MRLYLRIPGGEQGAARGGSRVAQNLRQGDCRTWRTAGTCGSPSLPTCLISALAYHELTTQVPHEVYVALVKGAEAPRIDHPPVRVFRFSGAAFTEGIEIHKVDAVPVRIYSPEKTIADCFKFRNKLGMDVVLEALKQWRERRGRHLQALLKHARQCRVERIMRPYLEALL